MNFNILNVDEKATFDNSIVYAEKHTHQPYAASSLNNNDEIRIPIQQQDVYTLPWGSYLYIEGRITVPAGGEGVTSVYPKFVNNGVALLFDEIRYEMAGLVIDRVRNPGITSTMKGYLSYNGNESLRLKNAGWCPIKPSKIVDEKGNFNVIIPLRMLMGFCEDFHKIILNLRQELVLVRSNTDINAVSHKDQNFKVELQKVYWKMPHVSVADVERLKLMKYITKSVDLEIPFRGWELHEYPMLQPTQRQTWAIKTATQLEKPRFVIVGFQTNRKNQVDKDCSRFDHCNLVNIKLYLNSEMYPYDNLFCNFENNQFALLYEMYAEFQEAYYEKDCEPVLDPPDFKSIAPLAVIDCSRQNEILKGGPVDIRLEFETNVNFPDNTTAYCLILHDKLIRYNPLTNVVRTL